MRGARLLLVLGLLAFCPPGRSETITWLLSDDPTSPDAQETTDSGQIAYLTTHLPGFTHHLVKVSAARAVHELQHGSAICSTDLLVTPERDKFLVFARRHMELPSYRLMVRKDRQGALEQAIDGKGAVDLAKLEEIPNLSGGYTNSRHYGPSINAFIQRHGSAGLEGQVATFQLFNLIAAKRIDYAFVMPMDFYFYLPEDQRQQAALMPVKGEIPTISAATGCSADPAGRAVIAAIDALLTDDAQWAAYLEPLRKWVSPEDFAALLSLR